MSEVKKYYFLKLKDNFFDSEEIKILENQPNGIYYSNLLLKLYLKSLKSNGLLRFNEFIPYDEAMLATITNLPVDMVRSGLKVMTSIKLIERLEDGTIYLMNIQNFVGKSNSEADRKRLFRDKAKKNMQLQGQVSKKASNTAEADNVVKKEIAVDECSAYSGSLTDKCPPEKEIDKELELKIDKELELKIKKEIDLDKEIKSDKEIKLDKEIDLDKDRELYKATEFDNDTDLDKVTDTDTELDTDIVIDRVTEIESSTDRNLLHSLSVSLLQSFEKETGLIGKINLSALKRAVRMHGEGNVKKAIGKALERNKPTMTYINGILKNWAVEGYPKEGEGDGSTYKINSEGSMGYTGFKPKEPRTLGDEERIAIENQLL